MEQTSSNISATACMNDEPWTFHKHEGSKLEGIVVFVNVKFVIEY